MHLWHSSEEHVDELLGCRSLGPRRRPKCRCSAVLCSVHILFALFMRVGSPDPRSTCTSEQSEAGETNFHRDNNNIIIIIYSHYHECRSTLHCTCLPVSRSSTIMVRYIMYNTHGPGRPGALRKHTYSSLHQTPSHAHVGSHRRCFIIMCIVYTACII